jgi:hypothetical protein
MGTDTDPARLTHGERARRLAADPERFDALRREGESLEDYYSKVIGAAPNAVDGFYQYVGLLGQFLDRDDGRIRGWVESDVARTVKNMLLGDSTTGRAFPVRTLSDVVARHEAYRAVGVETPTLVKQVDVIVEHVYDDDEASRFVHGIVDGLLEDVPDPDFDSDSDDGAGPHATADGEDDRSDTERAVEVLAQARAAAALQNGDAPSATPERVAEAVAAVTEPRLDLESTRTPATAGDCLDEARRLAFADDRKLALAQTAIHRDPGETDALLTYCYLAARDVIEDYRHGREHDRGRLLLAAELFAGLEGRPAPRRYDDWEPWVRSYAELSRATIAAAGRHASERDEQITPDPKFRAAAYHYYAASDALAGVHDVRADKYLSKAFRHAALGAEHYRTGVALSDAAIDTFLTRLQAVEADAEAATRTAGDDLDAESRETALRDAVHVHRFRKAQAEVLDAYERGDVDRVIEVTEECDDLVEGLPQRRVNTAVHTYRARVAGARRTELDGDFADARQLYSFVERPRREVETRIELCRAKELLADGDPVGARAHLEDAFEEDTPLLRGALTVVAGETPNWSIPSGVGLDLALADPADGEALALLVRFHGNTDGDDHLTDLIERQFLAV